MRVVLQTAPGSAVSGRLEFSEARWHWYRDNRGHFACSASVYLGDEERSVELQEIPVYVQDMVGFFDDMARHARGWSGVMSWDSESYEIRLDVENPEGKHATFDVRMRLSPDFESWWSGVLVIDADALPRAAEAMRKLTGFEEGSRFITPHHPPTWHPI